MSNFEKAMPIMKAAHFMLSHMGFRQGKGFKG